VRADGANLQVTLDRARRELQEAEDAIVALTLRAPRGGLMVIRDHPWEARKFQAGDPAWVGMPLALIPEPSSLRVEAALADVDDGRVRLGMPARIVLDAYPSTTYSGRVTEISAVAQESARLSMRRAFRVIVALDKIEPGRMRPGLSARVLIRRDEKASALLVPRGSVILSDAKDLKMRDSRSFAVSAAQDDGMRARVRLANGEIADVVLGPCNAQECVVVDGLREGDELESRRG